MCQCTPEIRTPFCGRGDCQEPKPSNVRPLKLAEAPATEEPPTPFVYGQPTPLTAAEVNRIMLVKENAPAHIQEAMQRLLDGVQIFMAGNDALTRTIEEQTRNYALLRAELKRMIDLSAAQTEAARAAIVRRDYARDLSQVLAPTLPRWKRTLLRLVRGDVNDFLQSAGTEIYRAVMEKSAPQHQPTKGGLPHGKS